MRIFAADITVILAKGATRAHRYQPNEASIASVLCHPDEASNASGRKDLGQLRAMRSRFRSLDRALRALL